MEWSHLPAMTTQRLSLVTLSSMLLSSSAFGATAFISEFHYDNTGGDVGESVEIYVADGVAPTTVTVTLYNGSTNSTYGSPETANDMTPGGTVNLGGIDYNIYTWALPANGLQNGGSDGFSIDVAGTVCEFLSYEGTLTPTTGPAAGMTSTDVGVAEGGGTDIGSSVERSDGGWTADDDGTNSFGAANPGLTANPIAVPEPSSALLGSFALLGLLRRRR